jgi:hypothetical protein
MAQYSSPEQQAVMSQASPQPSSYSQSYTTSPPLVGTSPATSHRSTSRERDAARGPQYQQAVPSPYDSSVTGAPEQYGYGPTSLPAAYTAGYQSYGLSLPAGAAGRLTSGRAQGTYGTNAYGIAYSPLPPGYIPSQGAYGAQYAASSAAQQAAVPLTADDPSGVRVVTARPRPQCWEHGCNGRQFSTFSNLLRHQREKSGTASKSECPRCGAVFTRTTARNGHLAHDKCKRKSTASASASEPEPER